jgi:hypothetical protein
MLMDTLELSSLRFHVGGIRPVSLKATCFQYVIEIPRRKLTLEID